MKISDNHLLIRNMEHFKHFILAKSEFKTAPNRPGCFNHLKKSGADPGPSRTTNYQPRITPDHQRPAKDEPRICHGLTRTTPDHAGFLVSCGPRLVPGRSDWGSRLKCQLQPLYT